MNLRSLTLIAFAAITSPAYADEAMTVAKDIVSNGRLPTMAATPEILQTYTSKMPSLAVVFWAS
jgi:hypothetical protein